MLKFEQKTLYRFELVSSSPVLNTFLRGCYDFWFKVRSRDETGLRRYILMWNETEHYTTVSKKDIQEVLKELLEEVKKCICFDAEMLYRLAEESREV